MLDFSLFRQLQISNKNLFIDYLTRYPQTYCDYSFTNLIVWGDSSGVLWQEYENRLYIYFTAIDALLFPIGKNLSADELELIATSLRLSGKSGQITSINSDYIHLNRLDLERYFRIEEDSDYQDYVYLTEKLANLPGKKLQKKKNLISQFKRLYPDFILRPLQSSDRDACLGLTELWTELNENDDPYLEMEMSAILKSWDLFIELDLDGIIIQVGDQVIAYSIFSWLSPFTVDVHFEKYDRNFKGAGQIINQETARALQGKFQYINREQDMQLEGLKKAKMSYEPEMLLQAFRLVLR